MKKFIIAFLAVLCLVFTADAKPKKIIGYRILSIEKVIVGYDTTYVRTWVRNDTLWVKDSVKKRIPVHKTETIEDVVYQVENYTIATISIKGENGNIIQKWDNAYLYYNKVMEHSYGDNVVVENFEGNKYCFWDSKKNPVELEMFGSGRIIVTNEKTIYNKRTFIGKTPKTITYDYYVTEMVCEDRAIVSPIYKDMPKYNPIYDTIEHTEPIYAPSPFSYNKGVSIGGFYNYNYGGVHGGGANITIYGAYADISFGRFTGRMPQRPSIDPDDNSVMYIQDDIVRTKEAVSFNFGYQIPLGCKYVKLTPTIGGCRTTYVKGSGNEDTHYIWKVGFGGVVKFSIYARDTECFDFFIKANSNEFGLGIGCSF